MRNGWKCYLVLSPGYEYRSDDNASIHEWSIIHQPTHCTSYERVFPDLYVPQLEQIFHHPDIN